MGIISTKTGFNPRKMLRLLRELSRQARAWESYMNPKFRGELEVEEPAKVMLTVWP